MIVYDGHAHVYSDEEAILRQKLGIRTMLSSGNPDQAEAAFRLSERYPVHTVTAGLHPWYTADFSPDVMRPFMEKACIVGEIGMDSVWCSVPLDIQKKAFIRQLDMAREMKKTVVLHTKGCETEIARIIEGYDLTFIVHWYSGVESDMKPYLEKDCYFTIGPSVGVDPLVSIVARLVPENRILFETDGMDAVSWAIGETPLCELPSVLENSVGITASIRNCNGNRLAEVANENYMRLINS